MAGLNTIQLAGADLDECRAINQSALHAQETSGNDDYNAKSDKTKATINKFGLAVECHLDIEPFAPAAMEKDWYAYEKTNWGALTCHKKGADLTASHCRCYILKEKSYYQHNLRSFAYQFNACLQCDGTTCKAVKNISQ